MTIRPATADDVEAVLPLVARIAAFHEQHDPQRYCYQPNVAESYRGWLSRRAHDPASVFLVAEREAAANQAARIVAFLVATTERELSIYRTGQIGFIHDVWVEPAYRNEGIARQLVTLASERFAEIGVGQIRLDVLIDNDPARRLFEACGFRASTVTMLHEMK